MPDRGWRFALDVVRTAHRHRTTGHAAEMSFFAVLTLVPSTVAVGAALGLSKHVIGESTVKEAENAVTGAVRAIMGFLVSLYRFCPNARHCWRDCLPGAFIGAALWLLAAVAFRTSAALGLRSSGGVAANDATVNLIGQSVNAVVATVLWAYLASIAILLGAEFNAALRARRGADAATLRFRREPTSELSSVG